MPSRRELANAIRVLSMDAVQRAKSGHPGAPMGMADIAEVLWRDYLKHNPANPRWADRDRFVLSNGHASMLLYALLHLSGYDLGIEDIKNFRQLGSRTAGHPEYGLTPGVETTTGPLGQGITNAVGMALAEKVLAARYNRDGHTIVDHYTYVFAGDGCLMEGVSHEACSLAGTLGLGKLIVFWDDNGISIDGEVEGWFADDTPARFEAYGWHVVRDVDGHDPEAVARAIEAARAERARPSLICCRTIIGYGSPNLAGTHDCHGAPLGEEEVAAAREKLGWPHPPFEIPREIYEAWDARGRGAEAEQAWNERFAAYREAYPELAAEFERRMRGDLPAELAARAADYIRRLQAEGPKVATRKASQMAIEALAPALPELIGGSADLTGSNLTAWSGSKAITREDADGNYIHYGVREFAMAAIMNGLALHGGFLPYGGTFLVFSDYMRNGMRMSALMRLGVIYVLTHDSIGLGEDGPTHQPVEHVASLRLIPEMHVWRPCDAVETAAAWRAALLRRDGPTSLALTRQGVPHQPRTDAQVEAIARGGYVLVDCEGTPELILMASGSEVGLVVEAGRRLAEAGRRVRVVSMPCMEVFEAQDPDYREAVLPAAVTARLAVEAGVPEPWLKYVGARGAVIGIDRFGESGPAAALFEHFGFTVDNVVRTAESLL
ncbi:transketolase [Inmirania thermothiophila]|uniref:Transketolase n=1 Tax=Inmirania thermothiophila TaxID=1750597 RepID=A0A3N1Y5T4_9GAMM|nr:transketolase [Inmirania thermothiophila]ROR34163.1 transketolase [Inmirania thermothiophila]